MPCPPCRKDSVRVCEGDEPHVAVDVVWKKEDPFRLCGTFVKVIYSFGLYHSTPCFEPKAQIKKWSFENSLTSHSMVHNLDPCQMGNG